MTLQVYFLSIFRNLYSMKERQRKLRFGPFPNLKMVNTNTHTTHRQTHTHTHASLLHLLESVNYTICYRRTVYKNSLIVSISNNPEPLCFNMICSGVSTSLKFDGPWEVRHFVMSSTILLYLLLATNSSSV